ncbi:hypothetical protein HK405_010269 [Cladochytrium tenue]|nr:hypothetical protein HK405_010269 [Cladochytrium tenue]
MSISLIAHLVRIVQCSDRNKMTVRNVGIVFSPTLGVPANIMTLMLAEYELVFCWDDPVKARVAKEREREMMERWARQRREQMETHQHQQHHHHGGPADSVGGAPEPSPRVLGGSGDSGAASAAARRARREAAGRSMVPSALAAGAPLAYNGGGDDGDDSDGVGGADGDDDEDKTDLYGGDYA